MVPADVNITAALAVYVLYLLVLLGVLRALWTLGVLVWTLLVSAAAVVAAERARFEWWRRRDLREQYPPKGMHRGPKSMHRG